MVSGNTYTGSAGNALHLYHSQLTDVQVKNDAVVPEVK
jgi:hypothetical protein